MKDSKGPSENTRPTPPKASGKTTDTARRGMRGPANVELKRPPIDSKTRKAMHEKYRDKYDSGKPMDIRHIESVDSMKRKMETRLNSMQSREEQINRLNAKDARLRQNASEKAVNGAAQDLLRKAANDQRNLFVGERSENRHLKAADDTRIYHEQGKRKEQIRNSLQYRKRYNAQKYLP